MAEAFPKVEAAKTAPPTSRKAGKPNPAVEPVKAAVGKGWQTIPVTPENVGKFRGMLNRAGTEVGVKVKTKYPKDTPTVLWFRADQEATG